MIDFYQGSSVRIIIKVKVFEIFTSKKNLQKELMNLYLTSMTAFQSHSEWIISISKVPIISNGNAALS